MNFKPMINLARNSKGMTLVEIMIVVAIVGFLAVAIGSQVNTQRRKAQIGQTKIVIGEVGKALDLYYQDCTAYPKELSGLLTEDPDCKNWGPEPYLKNQSKLRDAWANELGYENTGSTWVLRSYGADKKEGGSGYDKDISSEDL